MNDRGSMCKFRNARSAFRNLHVNPLSSIPPWETNKLNSILIFILYQNCTVLATKYPVFNTKHPVIILRGSLFVVTPAHVASWKMDVKIFFMLIVAENTGSVNIRQWIWRTLRVREHQVFLCDHKSVVPYHCLDGYIKNSTECRIRVNPAGGTPSWDLIHLWSPSGSHSFRHFSPTCFVILSWYFACHFLLMSVVNSVNFCRSYYPFGT